MSRRREEEVEWHAVVRARKYADTCRRKLLVHMDWRKPIDRRKSPSFNGLR